MGKIFNALEKYKKEHKELIESAEPLQQQDLDALLKFSRRTGKLNLSSRSILKDPESVRRLVANQLIFDDGRITAAGEKKCEELTFQLRVSLAGPPDQLTPKQDEAPPPGETIPTVSYQGAGIEKPITNDPKSGHPDCQFAKKGNFLVESPVGKTDPFPDELKSTRAITISKELKEKDESGILRQRDSQKVSRKIGPQPQSDRIAALGPLSTVAPVKITAASSEGPDRVKRDEVTAQEASGERPMESPANSIESDNREPESHRVLDPNMVSLLAPKSFESEQFKILRTNLLYPVSGIPPRSVLVTSVEPGDGKSFIAANLAVSVALNINRHVLLVDCDLRKPTIHRQFGFGKISGLSEYLTQGVSLSSLLVQTKIERLTILPGGSPPPNPSELLSSDRMSALLEEVTSRYKDRLIIVDSPPPTMTAETGVLARIVEGIIVVARYSKTSRDELRKLVEIIGREKIVGSVLNYFDYRSVGMYGYGYGRKYKNYY